MWRLSLRELLILVTLVALAIVSLTYASFWWRIGVVSLVLLMSTAAAIVTLVDRGARQAFAIGAFVTFVVYGGLIAYGHVTGDRGNEADFSLYGQLPTSRLLRLFHQGISTRRYIDRQSGEELPDFDPEADRAAQGGRVFPNGQIFAVRIDTPAPDEFMRIGHGWWALVFGYIGGRFGRFVYVRRMRESAELENR